MRVDEFISDYRPAMKDYCPIVITKEGDIVDSTIGHLQTLILVSGDDQILSRIPKDVSPLMYLAGMLECVIVDYENQIYIDELSKEQQDVLERLVEAELIKNHLVKMTSASIKL